MKETEIFEYFDEIYDNREQYNMAWAFKDAQDRLNEYKEEVIDNSVKDQCKVCQKLKSEFRSYQSKSHSQIKRQRMISSIFTNVAGFINVLEILLSVILVLVISEISHGDMIVHSTRAFSVAVVIVFAFIKVFIEQMILKPQIENLGWKMYKNSVETLKNLSTEMTEQLTYELDAV